MHITPFQNSGRIILAKIGIQNPLSKIFDRDINIHLKYNSLLEAKSLISPFYLYIPDSSHSAKMNTAARTANPTLARLLIPELTVTGLQPGPEHAGVAGVPVPCGDEPMVVALYFCPGPDPQPAPVQPVGDSVGFGLPVGYTSVVGLGMRTVVVAGTVVVALVVLVCSPTGQTVVVS